MDIGEILNKCDHTLLSVTATFDDVKACIDEGISYGVASVCIPPCYVSRAKEYALGKVRICTVIGFPNGYSETAVKVYEAKRAIEGGADEIDAVINVGELKAGNYDYVLNEIKALREATNGKILKIIIETCLLSEAEKKKMCELVTLGKADYIKTSTGFSFGGATKEDVKLLHDGVHGAAKVKASGGIRTIKDAEEYIKLGADRIGTSGIIKSLKTQKGE